MRESVVKMLDSKDGEIIKTLRGLGMPRNVASMLVYLMNVGEASAKTIETATDLRQPEVSIAAKYLRERGWLHEREAKQERQGRPMTVYSLGGVPIMDIIEHLEEEKREESARYKALIQRLRDLAPSL